MCVIICHLCAGALRDQKRTFNVLEPLELEATRGWQLLDMDAESQIQILCSSKQTSPAPWFLVFVLFWRGSGLFLRQFCYVALTGLELTVFTKMTSNSW